MNDSVWHHALTKSCPLCTTGGHPEPEAKRELGAPLLSCQACEFQWIATPLTADLADRIYNRENYHAVWGVSSPDSEEPSFVVSTKKANADRIVSLLGSVRGKNILEVGCGSGIALERFKQLGAEVTGVELAKNAAEFAARRTGSLVWNGTIESFPDEKKHDLIVAIDLIEHVANPEETLAEFKKRLKPGGQIVMVLPDLHSFSAKVLKNKWPEYKEEHRFYFSKKSMELLAGSVGLRVTYWSYFTKWMTLPYFFHMLAFHSKPGWFQNVLRRLVGLTRKLDRFPIPLPSGNALTTLEIADSKF